MILTTGLFSCATSYSPHGNKGGYWSKQVDNNTYAVYFSGNKFTSFERVWSYWFYRCAELTRQKGFNYFSVTLLPASTRGDGKDLSNYFDVTYLNDENIYHPLYSLSNTSKKKYLAKARIDMFVKPSDSKSPLLYDAEKTIQIMKDFVKGATEKNKPDFNLMLDKVSLGTEQSDE